MGRRVISPRSILAKVASRYVRTSLPDICLISHQSLWHTNNSLTAATILRKWSCIYLYLDLTTPSDTQHQLGMNNGVMFAAPIPERFEQVGQDIQQAVELALHEAEQTGVSRRGKEVTPWLLKRVAELTAGKSLPSSQS